MRALLSSGQGLSGKLIPCPVECPDSRHQRQLIKWVSACEVAYAWYWSHRAALEHACHCPAPCTDVGLAAPKEGAQGALRL